jgi:integrase
MPARHVLTEKQLQHAKPAPKGKRYTLWDAVTPSLGVRISDSGRKSFIIQRRVNGRMVRLKLGEHPALELAKAREKAEGTLKLMTKGIDPRHSIAPVTGTGQRADSFEAAVEKYIKREVEKHRRPRTQDEIIRPLRKFLVPKWGTLNLADIGRHEIAEVLDELIEAGKPVAANRTYSVLRRFFRWCVERGLIETNSAIAVRKPSKEEARSRVLSESELREVWLASEKLGWPFSLFIQTLILTGQRRNEVAGMAWTEIDAATREWIIPGNRTKNGKVHTVPLSDAMLALLENAYRFISADEAVTKGEETANPKHDQDREGFVFTTTGKTAVSGFSRAKRNLDGEILKARRSAAEKDGRNPQKVKPIAPWTMHDLRRSCATGMGNLGIAPHVIETVLNHSSGFRAGIAGVYQRQRYAKECRDALDVWARWIGDVVADQNATGNVVQFASARG